MIPTWQETVSAVQAHRLAGLSLVRPPLPELPDELPRDVTNIPQRSLLQQELEITQSSPEYLLSRLASGEWSSEAVTNAFLRRAGLAQRLVNCVAELLPEKALARSRELDLYMREHRTPIGPLHGLPVSVKEQIAMKGLTCNAGFVAWADRVATDDALILKILWEAGCVFYVRTTVPQTLVCALSLKQQEGLRLWITLPKASTFNGRSRLHADYESHKYLLKHGTGAIYMSKNAYLESQMHLETSSNLYGTTVNPRNRELTAGGSSGGEGALMALNGSCLGIGSDIGGSIRSPASNNGLYGFRPTAYRLPRLGSSAPKVGGIYVVGVFGPLSTTLEGVELFMKTVLAAKPWTIEPSLVPIPWREFDVQSELRGRKLKIGVMRSDNIVTPHPSVSTALNELVEQLQTLDNVEIVNWKPYDHELAWELTASLYYVDGAKQTADIIDSSGEPWRPLSEYIIKENPYVRDRTSTEIQELTQKRDEYRLAYAAKWSDASISESNNTRVSEGTVDAILCPAGPGPAAPLDSTKYWGYTSQWNLLDYPSLVFPVTQFDSTVDQWPKDWTPLNEKDRYNHDLYLPAEQFHGMPIALQLVGRPHEDEKVIGIMKFLKNRMDFPLSKAH